MSKYYSIIGWHGDEIVMNAEQLCERIIEDSKSDYNWIASATELVRVCKLPDFPKECADVIKMAIINCFANIESRENAGGDRYRTDPNDQEAVTFCYNSFFGREEEEIISVRKYYLMEMIKTASYTRVLDVHYHPGPTYKKLCDDWRKSKLDENISKENMNFGELIQILSNEFIQMVKEAEDNGAFIEDEKKASEERREFMSKIFDSKGRYIV